MSTVLWGNDLDTKWDGKYYGVSLVYNHGKVDNNSNVSEGNYYTGNDTDLLLAHSNNNNSDDNLGAIFSLGYNKQVNNFVYGLEMDLGIADYSYEYSSGQIIYDTLPSNTFNIDTKLSHDWIINLQSKIAYAHKSSLFYGIGGLSLAKLKYSFYKTDTFTNPNFSKESEKYEMGWNIGLGIEQKVNKDWSVQLEFLHTEFNNIAKGNVSSSIQNPIYSNSADYKLNNISLGLIKRF